jgi:hypothetical protein
MTSPNSEVFREKRLPWYKEEGMVGPVVQNPGVQVVLNPIELYVQVAGRKSSSKFPHPVTKSCCVWSALRNRDIIKTERKMNRKIKENREK